MLFIISKNREKVLQYYAPCFQIQSIQLEIWRTKTLTYQNTVRISDYSKNTQQTLNRNKFPKFANGNTSHPPPPIRENSSHLPVNSNLSNAQSLYLYITIQIGREQLVESSRTVLLIHTIYHGIKDHVFIIFSTLKAPDRHTGFYLEQKKVRFEQYSSL